MAARLPWPKRYVVGKAAPRCMQKRPETHVSSLPSSLNYVMHATPRGHALQCPDSIPRVGAADGRTPLRHHGWLHSAREDEPEAQSRPILVHMMH